MPPFPYLLEYLKVLIIISSANVLDRKLMKTIRRVKRINKWMLKVT